MKTIFLRALFALSALVAAGSLSPSAHAAPGDILETNEGNILRFRGVGTPATFVANLSNPKGLVFDGRGRLYVADAGKNAIITYTLPDGAVSTFASGLNSPIGLTFDVDGNLFVAEAASGNIIRFAGLDKAKTTFATGLGGPSGLAFANGGDLFVADFSGGKIYRITPSGDKTVFASGLNQPADVAFDTSGNLFVSDSGSGTIFKYAPDGTRTTFVSGLERPYGIAFTEAGNLVVADNESGGTYLYSPAAAKTTLFQSNFNTPQFLAVETATHQLLNVSTRGLVQTGDNVLIAGFVVGGNGPVGTPVLVRALGPSLTAFGVTNALADPMLELRDASGTLLATNNDWKDSQESAISGTKLQPSDDHESAIYIQLHGGAFTAIVRGQNGTTGTAVVEVYNFQ
jgi:sugar lactone lactonase YvrE